MIKVRCLPGFLLPWVGTDTLQILWRVYCQVGGAHDQGNSIADLSLSIRGVVTVRLHMVVFGMLTIRLMFNIFREQDVSSQPSWLARFPRKSMPTLEQKTRAAWNEPILSWEAESGEKTEVRSWKLEVESRETLLGFRDYQLSHTCTRFISLFTRVSSFFSRNKEISIIGK